MTSMNAFFSSESFIWWVIPRWIRKVKYLKLNKFCESLMTVIILYTRILIFMMTLMRRVKMLFWNLDQDEG